MPPPAFLARFRSLFERSWVVRYGVATAAVLLALVFRILPPLAAGASLASSQSFSLPPGIEPKNLNHSGAIAPLSVGVSAIHAQEYPQSIHH